MAALHSANGIYLTDIMPYAHTLNMRNDLRQARIAAGITQADLAARVGKDQGTISRYESGKASVDIDVAPRIAAALNLDVLIVLYGRSPSEAA